MTLSGIRENAGISQRKLAARLKKPQSFISNYESGRGRIDLVEFLKITAALGVDPVNVFTHIMSEILRAT